MAWDTTKSAGNVIASADWNAMVTDQKTRLANPLTADLNLATYAIIGSGSGFTLGSTTSVPKLISVTTTQRDALTPANGMLIYNTTTATFQKYEAGAWAALGGAGVTDHALLTNLNWAAAGHTIDGGVDFNSNALTEVASITIGEDGWIGIGVASERLNFDGTAGEIQLGGAHLNIGANSIYGSGSGFTLGSTTSVPQIITVTTTQRDALTPANGMIVYNSTAAQFQQYAAGAWSAFGGGVTDHGALTGLADDDHTQYGRTDGNRTLTGRYYFSFDFSSPPYGAPYLLHGNNSGAAAGLSVFRIDQGGSVNGYLVRNTSSNAWFFQNNASGNVLQIVDGATGTKPGDAGGSGLGDASHYWNDVSYKTLTDRGCLGWFDNGVELSNGTTVPDTTALLKVQPSKELTVYGVPRYNYSTMPKVVYKKGDPLKTVLQMKTEIETELQTTDPVEQSGRFEQLNTDWMRCQAWEAERGINGPCGDEGAETTALISILMGSVRELTLRLQMVEKQFTPSVLIPTTDATMVKPTVPIASVGVKPVVK